jgi:hypothetical protein
MVNMQTMIEGNIKERIIPSLSMGGIVVLVPLVELPTIINNL